MSGDDTILSKVQIVHRLIDNLFDPFPVAAPLYELVNVLSRKRMCFVSHIEVRRQIVLAHLRSICTTVTGYVTDDLREVLCVFYNEHMAEHFEVSKVRC
jgi:hypothetical protein